MQFIYGINERPKRIIEHVVLSLQHVFAMFGATILVPTLIGIDVSTAIFCAGAGTIIYSLVTKGKVPVFIGSSFVYIPIMITLVATYGKDTAGLAVMSVGLLYVITAFILHFTGNKWIEKILPPVVMGPLIIVIGLSLAPIALSNSGITEETMNFKHIAIAAVTLFSALIALELGKNFVKSIPVLIGIIIGYLTALILGVVDTSAFNDIQLFSLPEFSIPFSKGMPEFNIGLIFTLLPLVIITIAEHIGDHTVSSVITGKHFLKDPGLSKTLLGDGLATTFAGLVGGPVNTTYAENTGVIILTRVASVSVIRLAAVFAIVLAFLNPISVFISTIPAPVMGGISIILFGLIAQNGIRLLIENNVNFNHTRNMIICAAILVIGIGGGYMSFKIGSVPFEIKGMSLAAIVGIFLHLVFPHRKDTKIIKE